MPIQCNGSKIAIKVDFETTDEKKNRIAGDIRGGGEQLSSATEF